MWTCGVREAVETYEHDRLRYGVRYRVLCIGRLALYHGVYGVHGVCDEDSDWGMITVRVRTRLDLG